MKSIPEEGKNTQNVQYLRKNYKYTPPPKPMKFDSFIEKENLTAMADLKREKNQKT